MNRRRFYRNYRPRPLWRVFADSLLAAIIFGLISAVALSFSGSELRSLPGQVRVIDGDSLSIGSNEIRLWGIDAPEFNQQCRNKTGPYACGREAHRQLRALVQNATLICKGLGRDKFDRLLAVCRKGNTDLNAQLVRGGYAYSYGGYSAEEALAQNAKIGVWAADNERPKAFRDRTKAAIDLAPGMLDALYQWLIRFAVLGRS
jgi:endonuclease YncB( thermonuclease family)